jgi:dTDP-4-dehydrorhamnose 3,5-epimerase-like enzyme
MPLSTTSLIKFPHLLDRRGSLVFVEGINHIPFDIKRVYYLYDVPTGQKRGGHAHKELRQILIAISGSFEVHLTDGNKNVQYNLNNPSEGLLITPMVWRDLKNFSSNSVCLVMASEIYDENDYHRDYNEFIQKVL